MSTLRRGKHQIEAPDYPSDAAKIAWGGKVLTALVGGIGVGTELVSSGVYASTGMHEASVNSLEAAGAIGAVTIAAVTLADIAEHTLLRYFRDQR